MFSKQVKLHQNKNKKEIVIRNETVIQKEPNIHRSRIHRNTKREEMGKAANSANVLMCEFPLMVFFQKIQSYGIGRVNTILTGSAK